MSWIPIATKPPQDRPCFLYDGKTIWIGTYCNEGEGWVFTHCYWVPRFDGQHEWSADDAEWDDDYSPTHWMALPQIPAGDEA